MSQVLLNATASRPTPAAGKAASYYLGQFAGHASIDESGRIRRWGRTHCSLAADLAPTTSVTLADATGLALAVRNAVPYKFEFGVLWTTATITTGIALSVTTPTFVIYGGNVKIPVAADGVSAFFVGTLTSSGEAVTGTGAETAATVYLAEIKGVIIPSADGNLQVQFAAEVASAGNVVVKQGSYGFLWEL